MILKNGNLQHHNNIMLYYTKGLLHGPAGSRLRLGFWQW